MEKAKGFKLFLGMSFGAVVVMVIGFIQLTSKKHVKPMVQNTFAESISAKACWICPKETTMPKSNMELIKYGRELIKNTSLYLGPKGSIAHLSNGMNCQNCHLEAGTKAWGNNYFGVASTYPKFRERSGTIETIEKRVNDCLERSLNGKPLQKNSKEMKSIVAYMEWLGTGVEKGVKPEGTGITDLEYLGVAASPEKGRLVYETKCQSCHTNTGVGILNMDGKGYQYPPVWGSHSFNTGASLYQLSRLAGFVKNNMPHGATYKNPLLTDEEAWHVAAYIVSMDRPVKETPKDWPNVMAKPIDHPFGPYTDGFTETQHKYGPFGPIKKANEALKKTSS